MTRTKKAKPLLSLTILKERNLFQARYLLILLLSMIFFLFNKKNFFFLLITAFCGAAVYYHSRFNRTPWDFAPVLVLSLLVTRYFGFSYTIGLVFFGNIIPAILGGETITAASLFFFAWLFMVNALVLLFSGVDIITLGVILIIVEGIGSIWINKIFMGMPVYLTFTVSIFTILVRIIYMFTLGTVLAAILQQI